MKELIQGVELSRERILTLVENVFVQTVNQYDSVCPVGGEIPSGDSATGQ